MASARHLFGPPALLLALALLVTRAAATATLFPPGQEPVHQGCYVNRDPTCTVRPLSFMAAVEDNHMTVELCRQRAANRFVQIFGLEYGRECWLDPDNTGLEAATHLGPSENCTMPCTGDSGYTCGGDYTVNLYSLVAPPVMDIPPAPSSRWLGCYMDDQLHCRMWPLWRSANMSQDFCAHIAFQEGMMFYAMQDGTECWGTQDVQFAQAMGPSVECNMPCPGNASQTCGGYLGLQMYKLLDHPWITTSDPDTPDAAPLADAAPADGATGSSTTTPPPSFTTSSPSGGASGATDSSPTDSSPTDSNPTDSSSTDGSPTGGSDGRSGSSGGATWSGTGGSTGGSGPWGATGPTGAATGATGNTGASDPLLQVSDPLAQNGQMASTGSTDSAAAEQGATGAAPQSPTGGSSPGTASFLKGNVDCSGANANSPACLGSGASGVAVSKLLLAVLVGAVMLHAAC